MPVPTDITAGTLTITNGSTAVTGVGTAWLASDLRQGDIILWIEGGDGFQTPILAGVPASNTAITLAEPWEGPTLTGVRYRIRYQWDSSRVSAQSRQLIERLDNGNILSFASLTGPGVPVFDGPHNLVIKPEADFINGVNYDVQVNTLADRAAYDGQAAGYTVLVSDVGDGRSAIYSKASGSSGDWTDAAYVTGPLGDTPDIDATVANSPPGTTPTVTPVPITGGTRLDFVLPEASGFNNAGVYSAANAYNQDDVVRHNGSSFIALQAVPAGTTPSSAFPPVDTAYWQVLAAKGADGTGTGDVVGPASAVADRVVLFSGTTGKLIKDSGIPGTAVLRGAIGLVDNRLLRSDGTSGLIAQGSAATLSDTGILDIAGLTINSLASKTIRNIQVLSVPGAPWSTTGTALVASENQAYTSISTTSNLLIVAVADVEYSLGAAGNIGGRIAAYRFDGSTYVLTSKLNQADAIAVGVTGTNNIHRGSLISAGILVDTDRRGDNPSLGWAFGLFFGSYYSGSVFQITRQRYILVEFEP